MKARPFDTPSARWLLALSGLLAGLAPSAAFAAEEPGPSAPPTVEERTTSPVPAGAGPLQAEDVVITGTWTPHAQKDSPVEIERVTGAMLQQAGATNVRLVLQDIPAVEFRRSGGRFQQFQIQGLESIHTLILVNGQELIGSTEGGTFTETLLASPDIAAIEVVKGAASVQYGSDAIGGVINIRTKQGSKPLGATLMGQYGRFNTVTTFAAPEFRSSDGRFGMFLSAGISKSDGFDLDQRTPVTNGDPAFSTKTIGGTFDYKLSDRHTFSWYTHYSDNDRNSRGGAAPTSTRSETVSGNERAQNVLRWDWTPDAASTLTLWGHHQTFQNDSRTFTLGSGALTRTSRFTQELWEPQLQYTRQIGDMHLVTIGGEHDIRKIRGQGFVRPDTPKDLTESAGWIQDEISLLPWMDLVLGSRYTSNSEAGGFWSPQTTLLLKPGNWRGRFSYTRGFRSPTLSELGAAFVEGGFFGIVGNPNLAPEKSSSYTANVEYYFERAKLGGSFFRHDVSNLIQFQVGTCSPAEAAGLGVAPNFCTRPFNVATVRSQGFELEGGIRPLDWLSLETGYMYLDSVDRITGQFLFGRSPHTWKTRLNIEYAGWTFTTRLRYFSSFGFADANSNGRIDRNANELSPANVQVDMRLAKALKNGIEVYLGADNITESRVQVGGVAPLEGQHLYYVGMRMTL